MSEGCARSPFALQPRYASSSSSSSSTRVANLTCTGRNDPIKGGISQGRRSWGAKPPTIGISKLDIGHLPGLIEYVSHSLLSVYYFKLETATTVCRAVL